MKIAHTDPKAALAQVAAERKPAGKADAPAGAEDSAKVDISNAAAALSTDANDGSFDSAKVERIAQAIRDGKFEVNAEAIADKLISNAQELLGRRSS